MNYSFKHPLITTILPTYRRPKLLKRAIESVLNQTYPYFQLHIHYNDSDNETVKVIEEFAKKDARIRYYCHEKDIAPHKKMNSALSHINTPFFSFFADDDILLPDFYKFSLEQFEKFPNAMFTTGITLVVDNQKNIKSANVLNLTPGIHKPPEGIITILKNWPISWTGILFRREVIKEIGYFDEETFSVNDLDLELRIAAIYPFAVFHKPVAIFSDHPETSSYTIFFPNHPGPGNYMLRYTSIWPSLLKTIWHLIKDERTSLEVKKYATDAILDYLKKHLFNTGLKSIIFHNYKEAAEIIKIFRVFFNSKIPWLTLSTIFWCVQRSALIEKFLFFLYKKRKEIGEKHSLLFKKRFEQCLKYY